jgi:CPA1 family monovalent cation:H+ antiporter
MFTVPYLIRALDRRPSQAERRVAPAPRIVVAWAGLRGAVSLAAALSLPLETDAGAPFPERELLIFLAYCVVLFTVVVQGLTLPALIRRLEVREDGSAEAAEEHAARIAAAEAALERLDGLAGEDWARDETLERLRGLYDFRRRRFATLSGEDEDEDGIQERSLAYQRVMHELIEAQREAIVRMRDEGLISSDVMRRVERDLDLEESRLEI